MRDESALHVGRDGVDVRGRDSIMVVVLLVFAASLTWIFLQQVDKSTALTQGIASRMEVIQSEHDTLRASMDSNTHALNGVNDQVALNNWLLLATPAEEKEAKRIIGRPKLLNNPYPVRP